MILYSLRTLVYFQSFIWLILLKYVDDFDPPVYFKSVLWASSFYLSYAVLKYNISFNQYTSNLLSLYILMVLVCFSAFYHRFGFKDAVALSFLLVFINSYYWESMFHFNAIVFYGLSFNQIIQMFHLLPAYFLVKELEFYNARRVIKLILYGVIVSGLHLTTTILFNYVIGKTFYFITTPIVRLITLGILINIVLYEVKEIKKGS